MKILLRFCVFITTIAGIIPAFITPASAQLQIFDFSGNSIDSYNCSMPDGTVMTLREAWANYGGVSDLNANTPGLKSVANGRFLCPSIDGIVNEAILRPPALQQIEVWFVRILYVVWALVASFSFFFLVALAYQWLISRGDVTRISEIRQKIIYYFIGLALVFLAVPILTTVFRVLGINRNVACYDVAMPGFQFFFTELCTDPRGVETDPCSVTDLLAQISAQRSGQSLYACPVRGEIKSCTVQLPLPSGDVDLFTGNFCCSTNGDQVWVGYFGPAGNIPVQCQ